MEGEIESGEVRDHKRRRSITLVYRLSCRSQSLLSSELTPLGASKPEWIVINALRLTENAG